MKLPRILPLLFFSLIYFCWAIHGFSQVPNDSLEAIQLWEKILKIEEDTPAKANHYYDLGFYMLNENVDSAGVLFEKVKAISERIDYKEGLVNYYAGYTNVLNYKGEIQKGLEFNLQSIIIAKQIPDSSFLAKQLANIGISYNYLGDYDRAIDYLRKALTLYQGVDQSDKVARLMFTLGIIYNNLSKDIELDSAILDQAMQYYHSALPIAQSIKDTLLEIEILTNLGNTHNNAGQYESGKSYLEQAESLAQVLQVNTLLEPIYRFLSVVYRSTGQTDKAIEYAEQALDLSKDWGANIYTLLTKKELALAYSQNQEPGKANTLLDEVIPIAESENLGFILDGLYTNYAENLYALGNHTEAYDYYVKGSLLSDSIRGADIKARLLSLEKKYESAKKDTQILSLEFQQQKQKAWILGLIGVLLLIAVLGIILIQRWRYKAKIAEEEKRRIEKEQKLHTSESIIQGQEEERQRIAQDLHDGLGGLLSGLKFTLNRMEGNVILSESHHQVFNQALNQLDQAISEMRKVAHNMMPESLVKFGLDDTLKDYTNDLGSQIPLNIHYESYGYERMPQQVEITLYRIIQEAINNVIKHANAKDVFIQLNKENSAVTLTIEDNGLGFDPSLRHPGIGLKNIQNRVAYLNGQLEVSSKKDQGTLILIEIEIPHHDE